MDKELATFRAVSAVYKERHATAQRLKREMDAATAAYNTVQPDLQRAAEAVQAARYELMSALDRE
jgi:hypothetical protein